MSTLYLIRHGQASWGAADYDVLSELGGEQSRRLGAHLAGFFAARERSLDAVYTGPLRRQVGTADHLLAGARSAGAEFPAPIVVPEFNEYPAIPLIEHWTPILTERDPAFRDLLQGGSRARTEAAFELLLAKWARGELDTGELETFAAFSARVRRGLDQVMTEQGRGKQVAVITSGGPISVAAQMALELTDERTIRVAWVLANASINEFRWREPGALALVSLNTIPHLAEPALITYR